METGQDITIQSDQLQKFAEELYQKAGVGTEHAKLMADLQVETDLRNVHSHGTRMLPGYIRSRERSIQPLRFMLPKKVLPSRLLMGITV